MKCRHWIRKGQREFRYELQMICDKDWPRIPAKCARTKISEYTTRMGLAVGISGHYSFSPTESAVKSSAIIIIGELACGNLHKRSDILANLKALPEAHSVEHEEVMSFLEAHRLYGQGVGWVDAHLLASTLLTRCAIWTLDKHLRKAAAVLNVLA